MLEFIVLGHVPDTNLQLTFNGVLYVSIILLALLQLRLLRRRYHHSSKSIKSRVVTAK